MQPCCRKTPADDAVLDGARARLHILLLGMLTEDSDIRSQIEPSLVPIAEAALRMPFPVSQ